jgi:hypothetical protein
MVKVLPAPGETAPTLRELAAVLEDRSRGLLEPGVWTQATSVPIFQQVEKRSNQHLNDLMSPD